MARAAAAGLQGCAEKLCAHANLCSRELGCFLRSPCRCQSGRCGALGGVRTAPPAPCGAAAPLCPVPPNTSREASAPCLQEQRRPCRGICISAVSPQTTTTGDRRLAPSWSCTVALMCIMLMSPDTTHPGFEHPTKGLLCREQVLTCIQQQQRAQRRGRPCDSRGRACRRRHTHTYGRHIAHAQRRRHREAPRARVPEEWQETTA